MKNNGMRFPSRTDKDEVHEAEFWEIVIDGVVLKDFCLNYNISVSAVAVLTYSQLTLLIFDDESFL